MLSLQDLAKIQFGEAARPYLRVYSWGSVASVINIRGFTAGGPFDYTHTTNADRSVATQRFELTEIPLMLYCGTSSCRRGQAYISLTLELGGYSVGVLCSGYTYIGHALAWPNGVVEENLQGMGNLLYFTGTDPAANVEIAQAVPTGAHWRPLQMALALVTDATVANRTVHFVIDDGVNLIWQSPEMPVQAATLTRVYLLTRFQSTGASAEAAFDVSGIIRTMLPDIRMKAGYRIRTTTALRAGGDNWGPPMILTEEWLEP